MGVINVNKSCGVVIGNTGAGKCWNDLAIWDGVMFGPTGVDFDAATLASVKTQFATNILNDSATQRFRPLQDIIEVTVSGGDPITFTQPSTQRAIITADGYQSFIIRYSDGGFCLSNRLRGSGALSTGIIGFMRNGKALCAASQTQDKFQFIPIDFYPLPAIAPTQPSEAPSYRFQFSVDPYYMNEGSSIIDFNPKGLGYLKSLQGLQDIKLYQAAARAAGVFHIGATTDCESLNFYDEGIFFGNALLWAPVNATTLKPIAVVSAVTDNVNKGTTVTLDTTDANYTATANGILMKLAGPTLLAANNIIGYESIGVLQ